MAALLLARAGLRLLRPWPVLGHWPPASAAPAGGAHPVPPLPLCERPAVHEATLEQLLAWWRDATDAVAAVGDAFAADGGPTAAELRRELDWLLDDSVAAASSAGEPPAGRGAQPAGGASAAAAAATAAAAAADGFEAVTWARLRAALPASPPPRGGAPPGAAAGAAGRRVRLRAGLPDLSLLWERRLRAREPLQYLTGAAHWRDLILIAAPGALIPRPETETLVDLVLEEIAADPQGAAAGPWADLGTGTGAIAIALARALPPRRAEVGDEMAGPSTSGRRDGGAGRASRSAPRVIATDLSPAAAAVAAANLARYGLIAPPSTPPAQEPSGTAAQAARPWVDLRLGSWLEPLAAEAGTLAGIVSNPPYIPASDMPGLQAEVGWHEPASALDGGPGAGLAPLRDILSGAAAALAPGGLLALETGAGGQAEALVRDLQAGGAFEACRAAPDLAGRTRFVLARRRR